MNMNVYELGEDLVVECIWEVFELVWFGWAVDTGLFYDSLEVLVEVKLMEEWIVFILWVVCGDLVWLDVDRLKVLIFDVCNSFFCLCWFWFNQIVVVEDVFFVLYEWDVCCLEGVGLQLGDEIVLFFDGFKFDDAMGLAACCLSDGFVIVVGVW